MKKIISLLIGTLFSFAFAKQEAVILTDDNFEDLTNASASTNTGDWLILFCEVQRFQKCRDMVPFWDELSGVLFGKTSVAYVDV